MTGVSSPGDPSRAPRVAFTAAVGSHLDTASCIERAMRADVEGLASTVIDLVGFSPWDARDVPYVGDAARVSFELRSCGLGSARIDSFTWPQVLTEASRLLGKIGPDLLVTMDDSWYDQHALICAARSAGVPAVMVQEGPFTDGIAPATPARRRRALSWSALMDSDAVRRLRRRPLPVTLPSYGRGGASAVLAVSERYRTRFIEAGVQPDHVHVAGVPRYDSLPRLRRLHDERRLTGSRQDPARILLLSQPYVRYHELTEAEFGLLAAIARESLVEVGRRTGATIDVRMHPSDRESDMHALVGDDLKARLVQPSEPLVHSLPAYDVVVGFSSSGLLEAMGVGVPIVVLESPPIAFRTQFFRDVGVPVATDTADAIRFISEAATSRTAPELSPRVTDEVGVLDGMASRRVAEQCWRLLTEAGRKLGEPAVSDVGC